MGRTGRALAGGKAKNYSDHIYTIGTDGYTARVVEQSGVLDSSKGFTVETDHILDEALNLINGKGITKSLNGGKIRTIVEEKPTADVALEWGHQNGGGVMGIASRTPSGRKKVIAWFAETIDTSGGGAALKLYYYEDFQLKSTATYVYTQPSMNFYGLHVSFSSGNFRFSCDFDNYYVSSVSHNRGGLDKGSLPAFAYDLYRYMLVIKR